MNVHEPRYVSLKGKKIICFALLSDGEATVEESCVVLSNNWSIFLDKKCS